MSTSAMTARHLCAEHVWQAFSGGDLARCAVCALVSTARVPEFVYQAEYFHDDSRGGYDFDSAFSQDFDAARFIPELERLEDQGLKGTLLDIGCATGRYLSLARDRGWQVSGVEVAEFGRAESARRSGACVAASCDDLPPGAAYDVVTLHHVLEHITDPHFLRDAVAPRVKQRLLIEVPNFGSLAARVHGRRWRDLRLEQHVCHYTVDTLPRLVADAGLQVMRVYSLWQPLWSLHAAKELALLTMQGIGGVDRRWDEVAGDSAASPAPDRRHYYQRPGGVRRVLSALSRAACRPLVAGLERAGLGERLVVEAAPKGLA
jgi:SAM-dependent methyltransferase